MDFGFQVLVSIEEDDDGDLDTPTIEPSWQEPGFYHDPLSGWNVGYRGLWLQEPPEQVPVHFGWKGTPTRYVHKIMFLILPFALSIAPVTLLLVTRYRFSLINKYPFTINLPAFYTYLWRLPSERRSLWVNRYFEGILWIGAFLSLYLLILEYGIYEGTLKGHLPLWFTPAALGAPILLVIPWIFYLARFSRQMAREADRFSTDQS